MAVSVIAQSGAALGAYGSQVQADDAQEAGSLAGLQRRDASARTSLSPVGRVRSSLDELQARAQALKSFSKPPTLDDFRTVVQGFVQSFNALNKTVHEVNSRKPGVLDAESGPGRALGEIHKAISGTDAGGSASLRGQGIDRLKEGALAINQNTFGKAFQADRQGALNAYSEMADRVGKVIGRQSPSNDLIGAGSQDLSARGHGAEVSRTISQPKLDIQKSFQQHLAAHLANAGGYVARNAVATYFSVASM